MVKAGADVWPQLIALVQELPTIGVGAIVRQGRIDRSTDLVRDLGLLGDDAHEFMEKYALSFDVEKGDYQEAAYFPSEGLWLLPTFGRKKSLLPITLGMLEVAALDGIWNSERLNSAYTHKNYE